MARVLRMDSGALLFCILLNVSCQLQPRSKNDVIVLGRSCVQEVDDYRQCLAQVRDDIDRRFNSTERFVVGERIRKCLIDHGCRDPLEEQIARGLIRKEHDKCMQVATAHATTIVNDCVQRTVAEFSLVADLPSLEDDVAEVAKSEFPTRGPWGLRNRDRPGLLRMAIRALAYVKNSRICDVTANATGLHLCFSRLFREMTAGRTVFEEVVEAEQKFNYYCSGRDRCRQWMTEACQRYLDDGKAATCRCAKLDLFTKSSQVTQAFSECVDKDAIHVAAPKINEDLIRTYCTPSRDPCIENFPPRYQLNIFN